MDTEEDMPRPNELQDGTMAEVNALRDLLSQIGDPDAAHDAGVIDDDEYAERKARKLAYTAALAAYDSGETPRRVGAARPDARAGVAADADRAEHGKHRLPAHDGRR